MDIERTARNLLGYMETQGFDPIGSSDIRADAWTWVMGLSVEKVVWDSVDELYEEFLRGPVLDQYWPGGMQTRPKALRR